MRRRRERGCVCVVGVFWTHTSRRLQLHAVIFAFERSSEDHYDFHNYCLRKSTLRAYVR